ncbi:ribosome small subunit-dependent GTPase A [Tichowtungia aerotolerans]|uniref:Small ribosomal subunit biogenesis GTPase RsgA n=1 Tax=Tichowtungia aerotolerans TaxID=2697043 RepID=A0A6P1M6L8_9BACT|nr:ribosome small subunit-dependent GTPase A [Tichowtungia aerotolerans]QHI69662.1 ribosome small subunit-dependent GTPase A [Tichowtungia aerotolerans]
MTLEEFGFCEWFQNQIDPSEEGKWTLARVTAVHKGWADISDGETTRPARSTGRLRREARHTNNYLTVGDWVRCKKFDKGDFAVIHSIFDRKTALKRKSVGRVVSYQLIAANIDTAFVVHTLDKGYNLRKLERYLSIVLDSGIDPVILMTKKDLLPDDLLNERIDEVRTRIPNVPVLPISNITGDGLDEVHDLLEPSKTYCLIGASGVGKTSLINSVIGEEDLYFTLPVREKDGKGIHSTTWRELIELDTGALMIDTPGMRELGHLDSTTGIDETFDEITALEDQCRFRDCAHVNTKGCAIEAAVEAGEISRERYENFIHMRQESDAAAEAHRRKHWKNK